MAIRRPTYVVVWTLIALLAQVGYNVVYDVTLSLRQGACDFMDAVFEWRWLCRDQYRGFVPRSHLVGAAACLCCCLLYRYVGWDLGRVGELSK